jgi:tRNA(Ile)-lysidine synthase TilS/MesJ
MDFDFVAITLDQGYEEKDLKRLREYVETFDNVDYRLYDTNIWKVVFDERQEKNPCSLCASMRRGILYKKAEELGCNVLALGHHFDDIIETALINMFFAGTIKTMLPKLKSNTGNFDLIRPLCYVMEEDIISYTANNKIPTMKCGCKLYELKTDSKRLEVKVLLKNLEKKNPNIKKSIFNSLKNVNLDYIMGYTGGKKEIKE